MQWSRLGQRAVRAKNPELPVVFFTSREAARRQRDEVLSQGGLGITDSALELYGFVSDTFER